MQPVRVTSQSAAPSLPLHMVAIGTGATTGITIWTVASGRWAPSNFPTFTISPSDITWDWSTESSNYETLRLAKEGTFQGRGWQIESSLDLSQYTISQTLLQNVQYTSQGGYSSLPVTPPTDAGADAASAGKSDASSADASGGAGNAGDAATADAGGDPTAAATADLAVLFAGIPGPNVRITRMRSDVAQAALSVDMALEASADQSELSNIYVAEKQVNVPTCPSYGSCPAGEYGGSTSGASGSAAGSGGSSNGAPGGGGCSTTSPSGNTGATLAVVLGLVAAVGARVRRKSRSAAR